jgi:hypothetical protein
MPSQFRTRFAAVLFVTPAANRAESISDASDAKAHDLRRGVVFLP